MFSFSEISQLVLKPAGWYPERKVDPTPWLNFLEQEGYTVFEAAVKILEQLGGLKVGGKNAPSFVFDKSPAFLSDNTKIFFVGYPNFDFIADDAPDSDRDSALYFRANSLLKKQGLDIFPLGSIRDITTLFVVSDGRIFEGQFYGPKGYEYEASLIFLGETIAEAIHELTERAITYL